MAIRKRGAPLATAPLLAGRPFVAFALARKPFHPEIRWMPRQYNSANRHRRNGPARCSGVRLKTHRRLNMQSETDFC
jgi:hypothetical protein